MAKRETYLVRAEKEDLFWLIRLGEGNAAAALRSVIAWAKTQDVSLVKPKTAARMTKNVREAYGITDDPVSTI